MGIIETILRKFGWTIDPAKDVEDGFLVFNKAVQKMQKGIDNAEKVKGEINAEINSYNEEINRLKDEILIHDNTISRAQAGIAKMKEIIPS